MHLSKQCAEFCRLLLLMLFVNLAISYSYQTQRVMQRIDEMEQKLLAEGIHRREDIYNVHLAVSRVEERLNDTVGNLVTNSMSSDNFSVAGQYIFDKDILDNLSVAIAKLKTGLQNETVLNERVRRHVSDIDDIITSLYENTLEISDDVKTGLNKLGELLGKVKSVELILDDMTNNNSNISAIFDEIRGVKEELAYCSPYVVRPKSCLELLKTGHSKSGIYDVYPFSTTVPVKVYCDQETNGGGWTVFQRRQDGSVDFSRGWYDYEIGFGTLDGEFWLGNENIHRLLFAKCCYELRVDLQDFAGNKRYAGYDKFMIGPKTASYILTVSGYTGDAGDSLAGHNGHSFSTNDYGKSTSCSLRFKGGWWYESCHFSNLNGLYLSGNHESYANGVNWYHWTGYYYSLKRVEMKFREHAKY